MNHTALVCAHWAKEKGQARRADAVGGVTRHHSQLGLAHRAKTVNVADETFAFGKFARERLVDEMFERIQKLAAFCAQHRCVVAVNVESAARRLFARFGVKIKT